MDRTRSAMRGGSSTFLDVETGTGRSRPQDAVGSRRERRGRRPSSSYQSTSAANSFSSASPTLNRYPSNRTTTSGMASSDSSDGSKSDEDEDEAKESSSAKSRLGKPGNGEETLTARKVQQMRQSVGTVEQMWIDPDNLNFESDGQISDISEIWSQYGDEIEPHTEGKLHKWNPNRKNVSTKLSNEERGLTGEQSNKRRRKKTRKKDPKKIIPGMNFVPIGKGGTGANQGEGVYFLDFSSQFKQSLKQAREERDTKKRYEYLSDRGGSNRSRSSGLGSRSRPNSTNETSRRKFGITLFSSHSRESSKSNLLVASSQKSEDASSDDDIFGLDKLQNRRPSFDPNGPFKGGVLISPLSFSALSGLEGKIQKMPENHRFEQRRPSMNTLAISQSQKICASKEGGLGPRWPKGMWDCMDSYWRMIMAPGSFVITPNNYNQRFDYQFRQTEERISHEELEKVRRKVKKWLAENSQYFAL